MAKGKILVVGDESVFALDLRNRLSSWGYEVIAIAQIGEGIIKKTLEIGPDLVIMDIRPQADRGEVETARQICYWLDIPLIYLTTDANAHLITQLKSTPFSYILKPVADRELLLAIEFYLYKHCREKELAAVQEQAQRESLLRLITNQIHQTLDLETILQTAVREVRQLLKTSRVVVYQFMSNWQGEVVVEDVGSRWNSVLGDMSQDDCFSGEYARLYQEGRVRAINNIQQAGLDACHINFLQRLQVQANLIVPIVIGTKLWGLLIAHECYSPRVWQAWEIELLQQLALQMAIAIHQAELYQQAQAAVAQSQAQAEQLQATLIQLQATQLQLIQSEKLSSLGQMVAGVAHEINNAITFIYSNLPHAQNYAQLLSKALTIYQTAYPQTPAAIATLSTNLEIDYVLTDFPNLLQSMESGTKRICEIVLTLRNFSRLDEAQCKPVDLHEGIESTLVILQHRLKTGVKINRQYGDLPLVECHAGQINQVFLNLLTNALDAAGEQAEITIHTQQYPDRIKIAIRDNGPGIPLEIQSRIFDPFFTTKEIGKGTGLGLSICHQIICQGHHGQFRCISQPGEGAEFQIELPTAKSSFEF